jgi:hypothetical protein
MSYYLERQVSAARRVSALLALPIADENDLRDSDDEFDPWRLFPALFGSYSSAFDDLALQVLTSLQDVSIGDETLAHQMFREMLCTADFVIMEPARGLAFPHRNFSHCCQA